MEISDLLSWLENYSHKVPLDVFAFYGAFIEEIIAPIPSPFVMTLAGSIAHTQNQLIIYLAWLAILGSVGKTVGAWILYFAGDKLEDLIVPRFGRFMGLTHKNIESIGTRLNSGWKDDLFIFGARALPIIPSAPVSIVCGILKVNIKTYLLSTFFGNIVKNGLYLYLGYLGIESYQNLLTGFDKSETIIQIIILISLLVIIAMAYNKRKKSV